MPGDYEIRVNVSLAGIGFIQGANHETESGSCSDFQVSIQAPEPGNVVIATLSPLLYVRTRRLKS